MIGKKVVKLTELGNSYWKGEFNNCECVITVYGHNQFYTLFLLLEKIHAQIGLDLEIQYKEE